MSVQLFSAIFDGLQEAYGTYRIDKQQSNGKNTGKAAIVRDPRTAKMWREHLSGEGASLGIIPINAENRCKWGCVDVDQYPLDHKQLVEKIRRLKLPLVVCRSKSGGAHCFLFSTEWVEASDMQKSLQNIAAALGYGGSEVFPKQVKLHLDRGDVGNFLNLPYYNAEEGLRYAILDDGTSATLEEFFELYEKHKQTPEQVTALQVTKEANGDAFKNGPPCLKVLARMKISEGGRNNGLFNVGVYLRKANPDTWESEILRYNNDFFEPPLPLNEVNLVAKQVQRKDYAYKCNDAPINAYCNKDVCRTQEFGVGAAASGVPIANLRKYNSVPPVWFLDVNGEPLELDTDALMSQPSFQKCCMDQLNVMPRSISKVQWEGRISALLSEMSENESAIVEVAEDASIHGQFYDYLEEFCVLLQTAQDKEEILLRRPWTDEETQLTYFRLKDFEAFLKKNKFFELKSHKIAQRLRDINGESLLLKIKGRPIRVWKIPAFDSGDVDISTPMFASKNEAPF